MLAVVLAGGENRRLPVTKGLVEIGGKRLIEGILAALSGSFSSLAVSTNEPEKYYYLGVPLIGDVYPVQGPMTGIFSALSLYRGSESDAFFVACDMPFIRPGLVSRMAAIRRSSGGAEGWDAIAPVWKGRPEPLFAFYSARGLPSMEGRLTAGKTALREFLADSGTVLLDEREVAGVDPDGLSFININTGEDLEAALALQNKIMEKGGLIR
ncbi:MAG: molybdenum cofactor guanylyltransferase [Nitrospiraceae bacterium]|nr:molybdenum cofactor guanylyltransferase [Nitrospiraceae bacterium]